MSNMQTWGGPVLAALVGGGLSQLIASWNGRRTQKAESADLITQAAERIVGRLENEITGLRSQIDQLQVSNNRLELSNKHLEQTVSNLTREVNILKNEIRRQGGDPEKLIKEA